MSAMSELDIFRSEILDVVNDFDLWASPTDRNQRLTNILYQAGSACLAVSVPVLVELGNLYRLTLDCGVDHQIHTAYMYLSQAIELALVTRD